MTRIGKGISIPAMTVILVMAAAFTAMAAMTPVSFDDLAFMDMLRRAADSSPWQTLCRLTELVRIEENGRPGNIACPLVIAAFAPWVRWLLIGLSITATVWGVAALAAGRRPGWRLTALTWAAATVMLPWRGHMFVVDYTLNYIPATLLMLGWVWCWLHVSGRKPLTLAGLALLGLLTGCQHEGLVVMMVLAVGIDALRLRMRLGVARWALIAGSVAGAAWLMSAPGIWVKLDHWNDPQAFSLRSIVLGVTGIWVLLGALGVTVVVPIWRQRCRTLWHDPTWLFAIICVVVSLLPNLRLGFSNVRSAWFGQVMAVVAIAMLARSCGRGSSKQMINVVSSVALLFAVLFWGCCIAYQTKYYRIWNDVNEQLLVSDTGTVYADLPKRSQRWLLQVPVWSVWDDATQLIAANMYYAPKLTAVVPTRLRDYVADSLKKVPGSAGALSFEGVSLLPDRHLTRIDAQGTQLPTTINEVQLNLVDCDGKLWPAAPAKLIRFVAAPGDTMILVESGHWRIRGPFQRIDTVK